MKTINTVTGQMFSEDANLICVHEHLIVDARHEAIAPVTESEKDIFNSDITIDKIGLLRRNPYIIKSNLLLDNVEVAISEIKPLIKTGCNLLVELTSIGIGRDVCKLRDISNQSGLNIACGCGLFVHNSNLGAYANWSENEIAEWMIREIEFGIEDTGVRPGVIGEIGTSEIIYPIEKSSLLAAATASKRSGLPIFLHIYPWSRAGLDAIDLLCSHEIPANKICICHLDVSFDEEYLMRALDKGVYVEFDNLGKEFYFKSTVGAFSGGPFETDIARVRMLKNLIRKNYVSQLIIANDVCLKSLLHKYGGWGYDHMFANFIPMMNSEGIDQISIDQITNINPKELLFGD